MRELLTVLQWADSSKVREELDMQISSLLGSHTPQDLLKSNKSNTEKKEQEADIHYKGKLQKPSNYGVYKRSQETDVSLVFRTNFSFIKL